MLLRTTLSHLDKTILSAADDLPSTRSSSRSRNDQPRRRSGVAGRLLGKLHAGGEPELGVDVREVGLHGARRDESRAAMSLLPSSRGCSDRGAGRRRELPR